jgi:hypothetical protein
MDRGGKDRNGAIREREGYLKLGAVTEEVMASTIVVSTSLTSEDKFYTRE